MEALLNRPTSDKCGIVLRAPTEPPKKPIFKSIPDVMPAREVVRLRAVLKMAHCPFCGGLSPRHTTHTRYVRDLGVDRPRLLALTYSKHFCGKCKVYFNNRKQEHSLTRCKYSRRVRDKYLELRSEGMSPKEAGGWMLRNHYLKVPPATLASWESPERRTNGKKV